MGKFQKESLHNSLKTSSWSSSKNVCWDSSFSKYFCTKLIHEFTLRFLKKILLNSSTIFSCDTLRDASMIPLGKSLKKLLRSLPNFLLGFLKKCLSRFIKHVWLRYLQLSVLRGPLQTFWRNLSNFSWATDSLKKSQKDRLQWKKNAKKNSWKTPKTIVWRNHWGKALWKSYHHRNCLRNSTNRYNKRISWRNPCRNFWRNSKRNSWRISCRNLWKNHRRNFRGTTNLRLSMGTRVELSRMSTRTVLL